MKNILDPNYSLQEFITEQLEPSLRYPPSTPTTRQPGPSPCSTHHHKLHCNHYIRTLTRKPCGTNCVSPPALALSPPFCCPQCLDSLIEKDLYNFIFETDDDGSVFNEDYVKLLVGTYHTSILMKVQERRTGLRWCQAADEEAARDARDAEEVSVPGPGSALMLRQAENWAVWQDRGMSVGNGGEVVRAFEELMRRLLAIEQGRADGEDGLELERNGYARREFR